MEKIAADILPAVVELWGNAAIEKKYQRETRGILLKWACTILSVSFSNEKRKNSFLVRFIWVTVAQLRFLAHLTPHTRWQSDAVFSSTDWAFVLSQFTKFPAMSYPQNLRSSLSCAGEKNPSFLIAAALSAELFPSAVVIGTIISSEDGSKARAHMDDLVFYYT